MTETEQAYNFAIKMYGEKMLINAKNPGTDSFCDMCFWQNQASMLAKELAEEQKG